MSEVQRYRWTENSMRPDRLGDYVKMSDYSNDLYEQNNNWHNAEDANIKLCKNIEEHKKRIAELEAKYADARDVIEMLKRELERVQDVLGDEDIALIDEVLQRAEAHRKEQG